MKGYYTSSGLANELLTKKSVCTKCSVNLSSFQQYDRKQF